MRERERRREREREIEGHLLIMVVYICQFEFVCRLTEECRPSGSNMSAPPSEVRSQLPDISASFFASALFYFYSWVLFDVINNDNKLRFRQCHVTD